MQNTTYKRSTHARIYSYFLLVMAALLASCGDEASMSDHYGEYNLTLTSNQTGIVGLAAAVDENLMFGHFFNLLLLTFGIILVMGFSAVNPNMNQCVASAAFLVFLVALGLRGLDLVSDMALFTSLIVTAVSAAFLFINR